MRWHKACGAGGLCLVVVSVFLGVWGTRQCVAASRPQFVKLNITVIWGFSKGEEFIDEKVDEKLAEILKKKLKLKRLEVLDQVAFVGKWAKWYARLSKDKDGEDDEDNDKDSKEPELMLTANYQGIQKASARFDVRITDTDGDKVLIKRQLKLPYNQPRVEFEKIGDRYLILILEAEPW